MWVEIETDEGTQKVKLKDNKIYSLQFDNTLNNSDLIKTRAIEHLSSSDKYFTNIQLEFLTKNTATQVLRYRIYAEDVNGESDTVEKEFTVVPDLAPDANPYTDATTLRNEDSNDNDGKGGDADIWIEDKSTTDSGDQVERTWYYRFSEKDGWKKIDSSFTDMSFGKQQLMQQHKEGVGKVYYKLFVEDEWTDETLEEYITDDDYLSATGYTKTDVINVAPEVSLSLKKTVNAKVSVIGGSQNNIDTLSALDSEIEEKLMKSGVKADIDYDVMGGVIVEDSSSDLNNIVNASEIDNGILYLLYDENGEYGLGKNIDDTFLERNLFVADNDNVYYFIPKYEDSMYTDYADKSWNATFSQPLELRAKCVTDASKNTISVSGERASSDKLTSIMWSTNITTDMISIDWTSGKIVTDNSEKYVFFVNNGKTVVLSRSTGAYLTTLNLEIADDTYSTNKYIYTFKNDGIYRISTGNGNVENIYSNYIAVKGGCQSQSATGYAGYTKQYGNEVEFVCKVNGIYKRGYFNISTGKIRTEAINDIDNSLVWFSMGFDVDGNVSLLSDNTYCECRIYNKDNDMITNKSLYNSSYQNHYMVKDSFGRFTFVGDIYARKKSSSATIYDLYSDLSYYFSVKSETYGSDYYLRSSDLAVSAIQVGNTVYVETAREIYGDIYGDYAYINDFYTENCYRFSIDGSGENTCTSTQKVTKISGASQDCEYSRITDDVVASGYVLSGGEPFDGHIKLKIKKFIRTVDNSLNRATSKSFVNDPNTSESKVLVIYDDVNNFDADVTNTAERIIENDIKVVFVTDDSGALSGYQNSLKTEIEAAGKSVYIAKNNECAAENISAEINEAVNDTKVNAYKIEKTGTENTVFSRTFNNLNPGKNYYYEYDIKSDDEDAKLSYASNISTKNLKKTSDGYYIPELNSYIKMLSETDSHMLVDYRSIPEGSKGFWQTRSDYPECYSDYNFTVPSGMKAIIMFDYDYYYYNSSSKDTHIYLYLDDNNLYESFSNGKGNSSYVSSSYISSGSHVLKADLKEYLYYGTGYVNTSNMKIFYVPESVASSYSASELKDIIYSNIYEIDSDNSVYYTTSSEKLNDTVLADMRTQYSSLSRGYYTKNDNFIFEVPEGKKAFLKFDYEYYFYTGDDKEYIKTKLNDEAISNFTFLGTDIGTNGTYSGTYVLECDAGTNTLNVDINEYLSKKSYGSSYFSLSNIRLDLVDEVEKDSDDEEALKTELANGKETTKESGEWKTVTGSFKTANKDYCYAKDYLTKQMKIMQESDDSVTFTLNSDSDTYIKNLKIYTIENGEKVYLTESNSYGNNALSKWNVSSASLSLATVDAEQEEPEAQLIYLKGETVNYDVYYSDYENDPSKKSYWRYTHTPFNDGNNPDAAYIKDKSGNIVSSDDSKILNEPIESFYIDGKYTVEHWQEDNTGNTDYDLESNHVYITFYVMDNEIVINDNAPPTAISIVPDKKVKYGDSFSLIGVVADDDGDPLDASITLIKDGKEIYSYVITDYKYDEAIGKYPDIVTPEACDYATEGEYIAVLEVTDAEHPVPDIISVNFSIDASDVIGIDGRVTHTDTWNTNRQNYNNYYFKDPINKRIEYSEYKAKSVPRERGTNIFWVGEKFVLSADVGGNPASVTVKIEGTKYETTLTDSGNKTVDGKKIYTGSLWDKTMKTAWGTEPTELTFTFTANYAAGRSAADIEKVVVDDSDLYWDYHRKY